MQRLRFARGMPPHAPGRMRRRPCCRQQQSPAAAIGASHARAPFCCCACPIRPLVPSQTFPNGCGHQPARGRAPSFLKLCRARTHVPAGVAALRGPRLLAPGWLRRGDLGADLACAAASRGRSWHDLAAGRTPGGLHSDRNSVPPLMIGFCLNAVVSRLLAAQVLRVTLSFDLGVAALWHGAQAVTGST